MVDCNRNKPEQWLDASLLNHHSSLKLPDLESSQDLQMNLKLHWHKTRKNSKTFRNIFSVETGMLTWKRKIDGFNNNYLYSLKQERKIKRRKEGRLEGWD
mgnify:CR=1 FL=1